MLLIIVAFLMRLVDIPKCQKNQRCTICGTVNADCSYRCATSVQFTSKINNNRIHSAFTTLRENGGQEMHEKPALLQELYLTNSYNNIEQYLLEIFRESSYHLKLDELGLSAPHQVICHNAMFHHGGLLQQINKNLYEDSQCSNRSERISYKLGNKKGVKFGRGMTESAITHHNIKTHNNSTHFSALKHSRFLLSENIPSSDQQKCWSNDRSKQPPLNSSDSIYSIDTKTAAQKSLPTATSATSFSPSHSTSYYKNPFNSPNSSVLRTRPIINGRHSHQELNNRLLQEQHLQQCHLQQLTSFSEIDDGGEDISEESLKQNVAIVLSNLDRYNNALRSIILNEQVTVGNSSFLRDDSLLYQRKDAKELCSIANNNYQINSGDFGRPMAATNVAAVTPESDYNSNATTPGARCKEMPPPANMGAIYCGGVNGGNVNGVSGNLNCSLASSHDFSHDNSDYQWFLDYGYRDGCSGMQRSVLSALSASYNAMGDLIYYDDLAKNLDANLAEVDMESFRAEDIHLLLSQLPAYSNTIDDTKNDLLQQSMQFKKERQHANIMSHAMQGAHISQTSTTSTNDLIDNSFCKSELLFSPVKESHISVDSLDMEGYPDESDMILTCKANKNNYTIAFEGSILYSDDSFYEESNDKNIKNKQTNTNLPGNLNDIASNSRFCEDSMSRSAQTFQLMCPTTPKAVSPVHLQRYPSGNNNSSVDTVSIANNLPSCTVRKSKSLPNLRVQYEAERSTKTQHHSIGEQPLNVSQAVSSLDLDWNKPRNLLPMCHIPFSTSDQGQQEDEKRRSRQPCNQHHHHHHKRNSCVLATVQDSVSNYSSANFQKLAHISGSASSGNSNPPSFNLVKLFIKQKNNSYVSEDAQGRSQTYMDVSSGCWPSSDAAGSSSSSLLVKRMRKKSMHDSGKGSAVSRHEEEELGENMEAANTASTTPKRQMRARSDVLIYDDGASSSSTGSVTATNSPAHRRRTLAGRKIYKLAAYTQTQTSQHSTDGSNSDPLTQVLKNANVCLRENTRPLRSDSSSEMITRSMQTSCGSLSTTRSSLGDRFRCVPPSFLAKLNNLGEERQAPIYVIYPNYALPDLGFVNTNCSTDVIFSPFNYKMAMDCAGIGSMASLRKLSANENELLKSLDYKHIADWYSLVLLLPVEYRHRLQHIPEVNQIIQQLEKELAHRPLFCMSPPIRRSRPHICDCVNILQTQLDDGSSTGSSQQPSSGYRGSSTLLTDSIDGEEIELKQMYVYQYDQTSNSRCEKIPSVRQKQSNAVPRGILRKTKSAQSRSKRSSLIETEQTQKLSKTEKRRSLQEPPQNYSLESTDDLAEVCEEEESINTQQPRLSRKDHDARARAENFLSSLPRSELKYYAEIAAILETSGEKVHYDAVALKKEVSRVLSQQKKVSFNDDAKNKIQHNAKRFTTPPNSPNVSLASLRRESPDVQENRKIEGNRFKRLQIQWELMSKESSMLKELVSDQATKSGGSTPTSTAKDTVSTTPNMTHKSRIPRPVSYPAGRLSTKLSTCASSKDVSNPPNKNQNGFTSSPPYHRINSKEVNSCTRSPTRTLPPKRYSLATPATAARVGTPSNRLAVTAPNTPIRQGANTPVRQGPGKSVRPLSRVR